MRVQILFCLLAVAHALSHQDHVHKLRKNAVDSKLGALQCRRIIKLTDSTTSTSTGSKHGTTKRSKSSTLTTTTTLDRLTSTPSSYLTTTTTSTNDPSQPTTTGFRIQLQTTDVQRVKRLTLYVKFVGDVAQLIEDESEASIFNIVDGYLMYGNEYIAADGNSGSSSFSKSSIKPATSGVWSSDNGQVNYSAAQGFCYTADRTLVIVTDQQPASCISVSLVEDAVLDQPTTPTPTSSAGGTTSKDPKPTSQQSGQVATTTRTTTTSIDCTPSVYTATSRCSCRWSIRCNSHAVSEFGFEPTIEPAQNAIECIERCNGKPECLGLYFSPGTSDCYMFASSGDNVLYGYNTGPYIAAAPIECDPSCAVAHTTISRTTTTPTPTPTGCRYEEYRASGGCNCIWPIKCGTDVTTPADEDVLLPDYHACVDRCDASLQCQLFIYDPNKGNCRIWYNGDQPAVAVAGLYWAVRQDNWCPPSQCPQS